MKMANYILSILRTQSMIVFSWGFHQPTTITDGLKFKVQGFKYRGWVVVTYNHGADLFDITLTDLSGGVVQEIEGVYFDELVGIIDDVVERTHDYQNRVKSEYSLL